MTQTKDIQQHLLGVLDKQGINIENMSPEIGQVAKCAAELKNPPYEVGDKSVSKLGEEYTKLLNKIIESNRIEGKPDLNLPMLSGIIIESIKEIVTPAEKQNKIFHAGNIAAIKLGFQEAAPKSEPKVKKKVRFEEEVELVTYCTSDTPRNIAQEIHEYIGLNNIIVDENLDKEKQALKFFAPEIRNKLGEIGQHLTHISQEVKDGAQKFQEKAENYAATVLNAFSKLANKVIDNPKLAAAVKACTEKMKEIKPFLEQSGTKLQSLGKYTRQFLASKLKGDKKHESRMGR